jgi:ubiquinone/menaquinone biosynthesis C-methylase UbiE
VDERAPDPSRYVLGHAARELDRLDLQGILYRDVTRRAFHRAGLGPGMRVLDLGSGSGDVTLLASEVVGPSGRVVGVDREVGTVKAARARAAAAVGNGRAPETPGRESP